MTDEFGLPVELRMISKNGQGYFRSNHVANSLMAVNAAGTELLVFDLYLIAKSELFDTGFREQIRYYAERPAALRQLLAGYRVNQVENGSLVWLGAAGFAYWFLDKTLGTVVSDAFRETRTYDYLKRALLTEVGFRRRTEHFQQSLLEHDVKMPHRIEPTLDLEAMKVVVNLHDR